MRVTFDERPSVATDQRRLFMETAGMFAHTVSAASHTDITDGVLGAVEWLADVEPGRRKVLIFSDTEEDLLDAYVRDSSDRASRRDGHRADCHQAASKRAAVNSG